MMDKQKCISLAILLLAFVLCSAEPPRNRQRFTARKLQPLRQRPAAQQKRVLARQEAVTPYPNADELRPEVPFEEGNTPDEVYGPPDETYGPPEFDQIPVEQLPSEDAPEEFVHNTDAEEFPPSDEQPLQNEQVSRLTKKRKTYNKSITSRLVQKRKTHGSQRLIVPATQVNLGRSSALSAILPVSSAYKVRSQQYYLPNQPFAYTAHYQAW